MLAVYTHIQCMQNNKAGLRFTAVVNFTSELQATHSGYQYSDGDELEEEEGVEED